MSEQRRRALSQSAIALVAIAGAAAAQAIGGIHIQPLGTLCVVAFMLFTDLASGMFFALAVSLIYSASVSIGAGISIDAANFTILTIVNVSAACVAHAMQLRVAELARFKAELGGELRARQQLADVALAKNALLEYEQRYLSVGEFIPFGTWHTRPDGSLHMSQSFLDLVGMTLEQVQDGGWTTRVVPEDAQRLHTAWEQREQSEGLWESEYRIRGVDDKLYSILSRGTRLKGAHGEPLGWVGVSFDITVRKRAEERLEFLAEAGRLLALSLDPETTLGRFVGLCVPRLADWCSIYTLQDDGTLQLVAANHTDPASLESVRELGERFHLAGDESGVQRVVRTGLPLLHSRVTVEMFDDLGGRDGHGAEILRKLQPTSALIAPLIARGNTLGAITLVNAESQRSFTPDDHEFVEILCRRASLAYDNARLYARQQRVAEALQNASLPTSLPDIPGLRICATYRAGVKESEIGGDWYDAFELPDGELVLSVGDVAGKGLKAAVAMGAVRQAIRAAAFEGASPAEVLNRSNRLLCHQGIGMVTAAIAILNVETGALTFATAGHPPILCVRAGEAPRRFTTEGLPLGVLPRYVFAQESAVIDRGSLLVFYTDGLLEFSRDVMAGELAMTGAVENEVASPAVNSAESIVARVLTTNPIDDVAALTIHLSSEMFDTLDVTMPAEPESARAIRRGLRRLCVNAGIDEQVTLNILVAVGEAVSNVIQHAYGVEGGSMHVRAHKERGDFVVEVADNGSWRAARQDGHGRGITLMRKLMDSVSIQTTGDGTHVVMRIPRACTS